MKSETLLIIADSERDANMLYGSKLFVPDPFILVRKNGVSHLVLSDLEIDRATKSCPQASVHSLSRLRDKAIEDGVRAPDLGHIAAVLLRKLRIKRATVPTTFPLGFAQSIQSLDHSPALTIGNPFPERAIKHPDEVKKIREILRITQLGLDAGISMIRESKILKNKALRFAGKPLTSEMVRAAIHTVISQHSGIPCNTIVAGGEQACDPHERGHGPLKANKPIIIDVFPRSELTGYFGDITRTVVRGQASEAVRRLYDAVGKAQKTGFREVRHGKNARSVHQSVQETFQNLGYETERKNGHMQGFFHGTGHGLGLDIHEGPGIGSLSQDTLAKGHVVTVEPGLYYPGIGGVRLEDVVLVTERNPKKLTNYPQTLEI